MTEYVVYVGDNEWSALYIDGELDRVGDHYLVDERLRTLFGVDEVFSNAFLQGGRYREDVAKTVREAELYDAELDRRADAARDLRDKAEALIQKANELESGV